MQEDVGTKPPPLLLLLLLLLLPLPPARSAAAADIAAACWLPPLPCCFRWLCSFRGGGGMPWHEASGGSPPSLSGPSAAAALRLERPVALQVEEREEPPQLLGLVGLLRSSRSKKALEATK